MKGRGILSLSPGTHKRPREHTARCASQESRPQEWDLSRWHHDLRCQNSRTMRNKFLLLKPLYTSQPQKTKTHHCCFYLQHTTWILRGLHGAPAPPQGPQPHAMPSSQYGQHLWPVSNPEIITKVKGFCRVTKIPNTADFQFSKTENILMGLTYWSDGPFKRKERSRPPQKWETPSSTDPLSEKAEAAVNSTATRTGALPAVRGRLPQTNPSRWECSPAASWTSQPLDTLNRAGRHTWTPYSDSEMINAYCFNTCNLLCSKRKLLHNLVKRMLSTWRAITSMGKQTTAPNLLPGRTGCRSGVGAQHFSLAGSPKAHSPRSYWGSSHFPFLGKLSFLILQTWTQGSCYPSVRLEIIRQNRTRCLLCLKNSGKPLLQYSDICVAIFCLLCPRQLRPG